MLRCLWLTLPRTFTLYYEFTLWWQKKKKYCKKHAKCVVVLSYGISTNSDSEYNLCIFTTDHPSTSLFISLSHATFFFCSPCDFVLFIYFHWLSFFSRSQSSFLFHSLTHSLTDLLYELDILLLYIFIADVGFPKQFYVLSNIASFCFIIKKLLLIIWGLVNQRQTCRHAERDREKEKSVAGKK